MYSIMYNSHSLLIKYKKIIFKQILLNYGDNVNRSIELYLYIAIFPEFYNKYGYFIYFILKKFKTSRAKFLR